MSIWDAIHNGRSMAHWARIARVPFRAVFEPAVSSHHALSPLHPLLVLFFDLGRARLDRRFGIALSLAGFFLQCLYLGFGLILNLLRPLPGLLQLRLQPGV